MKGWIRLHRKLREWEWYSCSAAKSVFLHCLICANWKATSWKGIPLKRGQFFASYDTIGAELGLSKQSVRTALSKLKKTNEVNTESTRFGLIVTVCKFDSYNADSDEDQQDTATQINRESTGNQHGINTELTPAEEEKSEKAKNEEMKKPARLSSETYDVPPPTVLPEEGRQAGDPEFSEKDSKAPMTEAAWLNLAGKMSIETAFAVALYAEMDAKDWIDNDGKPVAFLAQFLRASWQREQARRDQSATKPTNGKREPWMIEADIKRAKAEISRIQNDRANLNHGGHGPSLDAHKAKYEDAWLAELRTLREEVKRQLPAEYAAFEREHAEHVEGMLKDGVPASTMDDDYALARLAERMPEELPSFERWDREWNRANSWKDPERLNPEARQMVKQLRGHLAGLENELRGAMVAV